MKFSYPEFKDCVLQELALLVNDYGLFTSLDGKLLCLRKIANVSKTALMTLGVQGIAEVPLEPTTGMNYIGDMVYIIDDVDAKDLELEEGLKKLFVYSMYQAHKLGVSSGVFLNSLSCKVEADTIH